jgi:hypothetical protein
MVSQTWIVRDKGTGVSKNLGFVKIEASDLGTALELEGSKWASG